MNGNRGGGRNRGGVTRPPRMMTTRMMGMRPPPPGPPSDATLKRSVDLSIGLIVVLLNIIEIILILKLKRKKKIFEIVLLSLSVADLLFGLSNGAISVVFLGKWKDEDVFDATYTTYFYFVLTSIFHLVFIAVDRLWAIVRPIKHNIFMTRRKLYMCLALIWVVTSFIALTLYLTNDNGYLFQDKFVRETTNSSTDVTTFRNGTRRRRPPRINLRKIRSKEDTYKDFMQELLSYFIIGSDTVLVIIYTFIIYKIQSSKHKSSQRQEMQDKVSIICVLVAGSFVLFTIPYALVRLTTGRGPFETNVILVANSGMNSIIYFFRGWCERRMEKKKKEGTSSGLTPVSTPLSSRHNINDSTSYLPILKNPTGGSRDVSPIGTPKSNREDIKLSNLSSNQNI